MRPVPEPFAQAVASVRAAEFRGDVRIQEIRSPEGLAPHALALAGDVSPGDLEGDSQYGTGRLILLHDEAEPEAWRGPFRVVCFAQAPLETDIGADGLLPEVAWAWLTDALEDAGAEYRYPSGTVTVVNSKGFGELTEQGEGSQIEVRASWTPQTADLGPHAQAWVTLLCLLAGLPPIDSPDVAVLRHALRAHNGSA